MTDPSRTCAKCGQLTHALLNVCSRCGEPYPWEPTELTVPPAEVDDWPTIDWHDPFADSCVDPNRDM